MKRIVAVNEIESVLKQLWAIDESDASPALITVARCAADQLCVYLDTAALETAATD